MKMFSKSLAMTGLAVAIVSAQSMNETVKKLGEAAGKAYVAPIVSAFGSNLNSGWYHKAPAPKKFGFHVEAGVIAMGTLLSGGEKTLNTTGGFKLDSTRARNVANQVDTTGTFGQGQRLRDSVAAALVRSEINVTFSGPTIIGSEDEVLGYTVVSEPIVVGTAAGDTTITLPAVSDSIAGVKGIFEDLPALPLFAPQITLGTIYGTNLTLRWLPEIETNEDIGTVKFFGFGIQHNPGVWLGSTLPVDLSVGYFTQTLEVGSLFKATSQAVGLNVSKTLGWRFLNLTPYGGVQFEKSSFDFAYDLIVDGQTEAIDFTVAGENKYRATAGLSVRLLAINVNADYNFGKYNSFSAGVMIGI
jgi:hypothetical protein